MEKPRVEVVIPVYNGETHLAECLESILSQTYDRWTAVVVNNCSTDDTGRIADAYAGREPRVRVLHCREFLGQADNYNRAISEAREDAAYIKLVEADNWITEDSIARMVDVAEEDAGVGLVSGYSLMGREILGAGVDYRTKVLAGAEVLRLLFLEDRYLFGMPTTLLFRASALRGVLPWFRPNLFYDDADLCVRVLRQWKLGYVHRILAFVRTDNEGIFSTYREHDFMPAVLHFLAEDYASDMLDGEAAVRARSKCQDDYYRRLARAVLGGRTKAYWDFHRRAGEVRGQTLRKGLLLKSLALEALDAALNPKTTVERLLKKVAKEQPRPLE
jgi:glycosyltransferase involved in cell wall biosynthesis